MNPARSVALAVSGHGFGHAVRSAEVARALLRHGARVVIRSDAPRWLFPDQVEWLPQAEWPLDIGVVQHGALDLDVDATRRQWHAFARAFDAHAASEARLLRAARVDLLVGDIPPLAFAAAAQANVPSFGLTNFTWDWIYSAWPDFEPIVARIRDAYARAEGLFRLPLHEACDAFARIADVPLIARRARRPRHAVRAELGVADTDVLVLLSFGGFAARGLDVSALGQWRDYTFVVTPPLAHEAGAPPSNMRILNETPDDYVSLVAACDVVVTKPGYGIVADCLANRVAVLFTDRGPFREYEILAEALPRLGHARYIPSAQLVAGDVGAHLAALLGDDTPWTDQPMDGAERVADGVLYRVTIEQNLG